jgi:UPF0042 nucleotide-binding protein
MAQKRLIIVSGLSGAGRSTALAALSDLGFQASDAVPTSVWPLLLQAEGVTRVAVGWPTSSADGEEVLPEVPADWTLTHVFLEADEATLLRRYSEARRVHPFDRGEGLTDALRQERSKAHARRSMADKVIDTTALRLPELRESMANVIEGGGRGPTLRVMSFGYRNGLPPEADLVIDLRWLRNPYYDPALREQTGVDAGVAAYVAADPDFPAFFSDLQQLLTLIVRRQADEGRAYFTIAMGCTGGRHRSVFMAERLGQWLAETGHPAKVVHRDTIIAKT